MIKKIKDEWIRIKYNQKEVEDFVFLKLKEENNKRKKKEYKNECDEKKKGDVKESNNKDDDKNNKINENDKISINNIKEEDVKIDFKIFDKIKGILFGLAFGDVFGCPVEGWKPGNIKKRFIKNTFFQKNIPLIK